jgi:hypothetical protein
MKNLIKTFFNLVSCMRFNKLIPRKWAVCYAGIATCLVISIAFPNKANGQAPSNTDAKSSNGELAKIYNKQKDGLSDHWQTRFGHLQVMKTGLM